MGVSFTSLDDKVESEKNEINSNADGDSSLNNNLEKKGVIEYNDINVQLIQAKDDTRLSKKNDTVNKHTFNSHKEGSDDNINQEKQTSIESDNSNDLIKTESNEEEIKKLDMKYKLLLQEMNQSHKKEVEKSVEDAIRLEREKHDGILQE